MGRRAREPRSVPVLSEAMRADVAPSRSARLGQGALTLADGGRIGADEARRGRRAARMAATRTSGATLAGTTRRAAVSRRGREFPPRRGARTPGAPVNDFFSERTRRRVSIRTHPPSRRARTSAGAIARGGGGVAGGAPRVGDATPGFRVGGFGGSPRIVDERDHVPAASEAPIASAANAGGDEVRAWQRRMAAGLRTLTWHHVDRALFPGSGAARAQQDMQALQRDPVTAFLFKEGSSSWSTRRRTCLGIRRERTTAMPRSRSPAWRIERVAEEALARRTEMKLSQSSRPSEISTVLYFDDLRGSRVSFARSRRRRRASRWTSVPTRDTMAAADAGA